MLETGYIICVQDRNKTAFKLLPFNQLTLIKIYLDYKSFYSEKTNNTVYLNLIKYFSKYFMLFYV